MEANTWESEKNLLGNTELIKEFETTLLKENSSIPDILTSTRKVLLQNTLDPDIQQPLPIASNKRKAPSSDKEYLDNLPSKVSCIVFWCILDCIFIFVYHQLVQEWSKIMKRSSRKDAVRFLENLDQSLSRAQVRRRLVDVNSIVNNDQCPLL